MVDRVRELGAAGWMRRQTQKALNRLRMIFEEPPRGELKRATIAGYEPGQGAALRRRRRHGPLPRAAPGGP